MFGRLSQAVAVALLLASPGRAAELPGPLVSTEWLASAPRGVLVVDVRGAAPAGAPDLGYIEQSVRLDPAALRETREERGVSIPNMPTSPERFAAAMRAIGLDDGQPVVLTHRGRTPEDTSFAAYAYWMLKHHGHDNVALLDGGTARWAAEKRAMTTEPAVARPGTFVVRTMRPQILAATDEVEAMLKGGGEVVDGRPFSFHVGLEKRDVVARPGHIPGSSLFPFEAMLRPNGTFRPPQDLDKAALASGLSPARPVAVYCNTGQMSAVSWFVLSELLGYSAVKLYAGSMNAWTKLGLAVETRWR